MKLKLKPVSQFRPRKPKKTPMSSIVKRFLDNQVYDAIQEQLDYDPRDKSVNVQVPDGAYGRLTEFYDMCHKELTPLGYGSCPSQDGVNMYSTRFVSWSTCPGGGNSHRSHVNMYSTLFVSWS
jgi:hypothetical protein